jgi:hypothetical protein
MRVAGRHERGEGRQRAASGRRKSTRLRTRFVSVSTVQPRLTSITRGRKIPWQVSPSPDSGIARARRMSAPPPNDAAEPRSRGRRRIA